jgi:hypothetical protein
MPLIGGEAAHGLDRDAELARYGTRAAGLTSLDDLLTHTVHDLGTPDGGVATSLNVSAPQPTSTMESLVELLIRALLPLRRESPPGCRARKCE